MASKQRRGCVARRVLQFERRSQVAVGLRYGMSDAEIAVLIGRDRTAVWRERLRHSLETRRPSSQRHGGVSLHIEGIEVPLGGAFDRIRW